MTTVPRPAGGPTVLHTTVTAPPPASGREASRARPLLEDGEPVASGAHRRPADERPRQPEAKGLCPAAGYRPLFGPTAAPESIGPLPFTKHLTHPEHPAHLEGPRP